MSRATKSSSKHNKQSINLFESDNLVPVRTFSEIAKIMNISTNLVEITFYRSIAKIRKRLKYYDY
ncbi:hypothetical protein AVBRAN_1396 [Campylobacter sp. RM12651]|nr:hypothetical protein AVBRAN_1396 [Campylobacter sp. RM12651]